MKRIKLSQTDKLEIENAFLKVTLARQNFDNLVEKKALVNGIIDLNNWRFDFQTLEFVEIEEKKEEKIEEEEKK